jgi:hypothetical protein
MQLAGGFDPLPRDCSWLRPVLKEWPLLVNRYCRDVPSDCPFWHCERANLSLVAAAAWRSKEVVALEEFAQPKRFESNRRLGRADLWLRHPQAEWFVEAKWVAWNPRTTTVHHLKEELQSAVRDAEKVTPDTSTSARVGLLLWALQVNAPTKADVDLMLKRAVALARRSKPTFLAWCFPPSRRTLWKPECSRGNYWPGMIMLGQVQQARRTLAAKRRAG